MTKMNAEQVRQYLDVREAQAMAAVAHIGDMASRFCMICGIRPLELLVAVEVIAYGIRKASLYDLGEPVKASLAACDRIRDEACIKQDQALAARQTNSAGGVA